MKIVYFVGAGASKAICEDRIPAMEDFFRKAIDNIEGPEDIAGAEAFVALQNAGEYLTGGMEEFDRSVLGNQQGLSKFKDDHSPARITKMRLRGNHSHNIEEVFGRLEGQSGNLDAYQKLLKMLGWLFCKLNEKCAKEILVSPYRLLAEAIGPSASKNEHQHTFISFNYDIWLEQALFNHDPALWHPAWGYGFEPTYYITPDAAKRRTQIQPLLMPQKTRNPYGFSVLKPHGSLSWYNDPQDTYAPPILSTTDKKEVMFASGGDELGVTFSGDSQPESQKTYFPYIVPPTPLKTRSGPIFWEIQKKMENALANADFVVIIGWSMPGTDKDVLAFIERTIQARTKQLRKVICCDKRGGVFFKRFEQIFWPAESPTNYAGGFDKGFINDVLMPTLSVSPQGRGAR
jgi:hypothetical protein